MRGRAAWAHLERYWGSAIAEALWQGRTITYLAQNGQLYEIRVDWDRHYPRPRLWNVTTGQYLCVDIGSEFPVADRCLALLEYLRVAPAQIESISGRYWYEV